MNNLRNLFVPRKRFVLDKKIQWFPGHMRKGIRDIGKTLKSTDLVLEVHDARIPFSGRNLNLIGRIASVKPVFLLLNKCDLINPNQYAQIEEKLREQMEESKVEIKNIFFMDSLKASGKKGGYDQKFLNTIINSIEKNMNAGTNTGLFMNDLNYSLLVMGIPNVGKSTVINRLRNVYLNKAGRAAVSGAHAGVTRAVMEKIKICESPRKIYLFDTPGILEPSFHQLETEADMEALMRCALCANISDKIVGYELIADYLLYLLNKSSNFEYMQYFGLSTPSDNITEVLTHGAIQFDMLEKIKNYQTGQEQIVPNLDRVANKFVTAFRKGQFGLLLLDQDLLDK